MEFDERLLMEFNGVSVLKYNNSYKYSTIFNSGISVTIEKFDELLQMMLLVPQMYKGMPYLKNPSKVTPWNYDHNRWKLFFIVITNNDEIKFSAIWKMLDFLDKKLFSKTVKKLLTGNAGILQQIGGRLPTITVDYSTPSKRQSSALNLKYDATDLNSLKLIQVLVRLFITFFSLYYVF